MVELEQYIKDHIAWSRQAFGDRFSPKGLIAHIRKEQAEIAQKPDDLMEYVDVFILALDGATRAGYSVTQIADLFVETGPDFVSGIFTREVDRLLRLAEVDPHLLNPWLQLMQLTIMARYLNGCEPQKFLAALQKKLDINKTRTWVRRGDDEPIEHDRTVDVRRVTGEEGKTSAASIEGEPSDR